MRDGTARRLGAAALAAVCLWANGTSAGEPVTDLRVVIDVSGSMKRNDPRNLRAPALRLLVGLLPEGTRAGVWTFGRYVNMNVRHGPVTAAWKARARREAARIHSRGLYTNMEEALEKAAFGWTRPDPRYRRHLLLLTDGMVDISRDPAANRASRRRILQRLLPRLRRAGVKIHTIALSPQADAELLATLSRASGGRFEQVNDVAGLQKVFLRLFEQAAPADSLPIRGNRFQVDRAVTDMTLLVFREAQAPPLRVHLPGGGVWTAERHPDPVRWYREKGYDLVTVPRPAAGQWTLETAPDPDNRVLVLTNLRLKHAPLPATLLAGDTPALAAWLEQRGRTVTRADFLRLVAFSAEHAPPGERPRTVTLAPGGAGRHEAKLPPLRRAGMHEIALIARGPTFERQRHLRVEVLDAPARVEVRRDGIVVTPVPGLLAPGTVEAAAELVPGGPLALVRGEGGRFTAVLGPEHAGARVQVRLSGRRHDGRTLEMSVERRIPGGTPAPAPGPKGKERHEDGKPGPKDSGGEAHPPKPEQEERSPLGRVLMWVGLVNLLLAAAGAGGWLAWRRFGRRKADALEAELEEDE